MSGAISPFPNTPSWRGAQLKHRDNFTFTFTIYTSIAQVVSFLEVLRLKFCEHFMPFPYSCHMPCPFQPYLFNYPNNIRGMPHIRKLTTHLHLVPNLKMLRAIPPLPNMSSWRGA